MNKRRIAATILSLSMILSGMPGSALPVHAQAENNQVLQVDLGENTGEIRHGAAGFLYGLGHENIPSETSLSALNPKTTVQKPTGGTQHPGGAFDQVADMFFRSGGKQMQVYLQDWYPNWPYPYDLENYKELVSSLIPVVQATRTEMKEKYGNEIEFVYVLFNEPDWIWYGTSGSKLTKFQNDWDVIYDLTKELDPESLIIGPGISNYNNNMVTSFLTHCAETNRLPDIMSWHELQAEGKSGNFYTSWSSHYNHYRSLEESLGMDPLPININEYLINSSTLWNCGELVQWISKFEEYKVDACRAYWSRNNSLNDLVTQTNNKVTGAWWLYKFYGEMTGETVNVVSPDKDAKGLQGLAAIDTQKKQARVLLGGTQGSCDLQLQNLDSSIFGETVHATVSKIASAGVEYTPNASGVTMEPEASNGPETVIDSNFKVDNNGNVSIPISISDVSDAYQVLITPGTQNNDTNADLANRYEAEYAKTTAEIAYDDKQVSGTAYVNGTGTTDFIVNAESDGYYILGLNYKAKDENSILLDVEKNPIDLEILTTDDWRTSYVQVYLQAGVNKISYTTGENSGIDYLEVLDGIANAAVYEAEDGELSGNASIREDAFSTGLVVENIGNGDGNTLTFHVNADRSGTYRMLTNYTTDGQRSTGAGGYYDTIDRYAEISVNGGDKYGYYFKSTWEAENYRTSVIDLVLQEGENTITFSNPITQVDSTLAAIPVKPEESYAAESLICLNPDAEDSLEYTYAGQWYDLLIDNPKAFRKLTYYAPKGYYGNINEIEFYTNVDGTEQKIDMTNAEITGLKGVWGDKNKIGYTNVFDGDVTTAYDCYYSDGAYVTADFGEGNEVTVSKIRFFPRSNDSNSLQGRVKGGYFVGSTGAQKTIDDNEYTPVIDYIALAPVQEKLPDGYGEDPEVKDLVDELTQLIAQVEAMDFSKYKEDSVTPVNTALDAGKTVLGNAGAHADRIKVAILELKLALKNLEEVDCKHAVTHENNKFEPSCTSDGYKEIICDNCDTIIEVQKIPSIEHQFGDWTISVNASADKEGILVRTCSLCKTKEEKAIPKLTTYEVIFLDYNGSEIGSRQRVLAGESAKLPTSPVRKGYQFTGWSKSTDNIKNNTAVIAKYERNPQKGESYKVGNYYYKITNASEKKGTVALVKPAKNSLTTIKAADTVKIKNITYKITEISDNAFKNNKKLKSVSVGKNVAKLGENAFNGAKVLKKITIHSKNLKIVGKNAFKGIDKKAEIKVPSSKKKQYKSLLNKKGQPSSVVIK